MLHKLENNLHYKDVLMTVLQRLSRNRCGVSAFETAVNHKQFTERRSINSNNNNTISIYVKDVQKHSFYSRRTTAVPHLEL